jgi:hypothetical protein
VRLRVERLLDPAIPRGLMRQPAKPCPGASLREQEFRERSRAPGRGFARASGAISVPKTLSA